ncbi:hypothetical protein RJ640_016662 [Escallonia rubra]|uniref:Carboxypeptidase n=1 Tax=Escallonia rubra TaxID=112253 RepID=A0AA88RH36_9ASTE|nr:hypothetical protein RJ640_016662 [Escallonia rubra]
MQNSNYKMIKTAHLSLLPALSLCLLALCGFTYAGQSDNLYKLLKSRSSQNPPVSDSWAQPAADTKQDYSPVYIGPQDGLMKADKIDSLPGQPDGVDFDQYAGYVTVDPKAGRALFYYFVESPQNSSTNPLVLWLNGGPGCSSLVGAWLELGPFRVNSDGKTLFKNDYAWNKVANVIFLESPAGVGFSYSNTSSDYEHTGDKSTARDAYVFLVNWLERFPQYKTRDFYITGESYAGHYVPQLAYTIQLINEVTNQTVINLKGIAIGNAWIDDATNEKGQIDYWWTHALISDETHEELIAECHFVNDTSSRKCSSVINDSWAKLGNIDDYNIYAPICLHPKLKNGSTGSVSMVYKVDNIDPCSDLYVETYLNTAAVQTAFHAKPTTWGECSDYNWADAPTTILPILENLVANGNRVCGDIDSVVPITSTKYSLNWLKLPIQTPWYPWYLNNEVGGYVEAYEGMTLVTVRGAGHMVPSYQPERALAMFSSFLQGKLPRS